MLSRKNPYLFKAKGLATPRELVQAILDAHLSSQEETVLGGFLEDLAVFICKKAYNAHGKSDATGMDLEFEKGGKRYLVAIKSGPNWGNASQIEKMREDFAAARKVYGQSRDSLPVECVNGCCYGKQPEASEHKGDYIKLCGQRFWQFISDDPELYLKIIEPIGHKARERNEEFFARYELVVDTFTDRFRKVFCDANNHIDWIKLTQNASEAPVDRNLNFDELMRLVVQVKPERVKRRKRR